MLKLQNIKNIVLILSIGLILTANAFAQTTAFTYQGRFTDASVPQPTNDTYNMQFALFDAAANGNQIGVTVTIPAVQVVNGIFTVTLDYPAAASFDNSPRFLQLTVGNTVLSPRQEITSAPYAIRARNATLANDSNKLGGIDADQYVTGQVVRSVNNLTNNVTLAAGSNITITPSGNTLTIASTGGGGGSGINNQTTLQAGANFNIDGTGAANIFNATTQYNIGGVRVLSVGGGNIFAGAGAGPANTTGGDNAFVGTNAGLSNTTGFNNTFFGTDAGRTNNMGNSNSFFGRSSGFANTSGVSNSFFGEDAGRFNLTGSNNAFFGISAGGSNTTGGDNTFVGAHAGSGNLIGANNSFFGADAGRNNTAINNSFFGRSAGFANTSGTRNVFFGVDAGRFNLTGSANSFVGTSAGNNNTTGANNTAVGDLANFGSNNLTFATALGSGAIATNSNTVVLGRTLDTVVAPNLLQVGVLGAVGSTSLCRNALNQISTCTAGGGIGNFIENSTVQQPTSNFNISGGGTVGGTLSANIVNSQTNFRIGGATVFSTPNSSSVVAGLSANHATFSADSTFFGYQAGAGTSSLFTPANTFIGSEAGRTNSGGANNSFVGRQAGLLNSSGSFNSFFGSGAGKSNTTASDNSFFGYESGLVNSTGTRNSFFGFQAGSSSINAGENAFFGYKAGTVNVNGVQNTFVGTFSGLSSLNGASNSLFGYNADATGSKNTSLGADTNASGSNNTVVGYNAGAFGSSNTVIGFQAKTTGGLRTRSTAIGADAQVNKDNTIVLGTLIDTVEVPNELKAKNITVSNKVIAQNVTAVNGVFDSIRLTFTTTGGTRPMCYSETFETIGLCPIILRPNTAVGDAVPSDTVNQQQTQINLQAEQIKQQQLQIEALKQTVCAMNPAAKICGN